MSPLLPKWSLILGLGLALAGLLASGYVSPVLFFILAFLVLVPRLLHGLYRRQAGWPGKVIVAASPLVLLLLALGVRTYFRYQTATAMAIPVQEYTNDEYPEDPATVILITVDIRDGNLLSSRRTQRISISFLSQNNPMWPRSFFAMWMSA